MAPIQITDAALTVMACSSMLIGGCLLAWHMVAAKRHLDLLTWTQGPKPYEFLGFGDIHGPKPYEFLGFGDIHGQILYFSFCVPSVLPGFRPLSGQTWPQYPFKRVRLEKW